MNTPETPTLTTHDLFHAIEEHAKNLDWQGMGGEFTAKIAGQEVVALSAGYHNGPALRTLGTRDDHPERPARVLDIIRSRLAEAMIAEMASEPVSNLRRNVMIQTTLDDEDRVTDIEVVHIPSGEVLAHRALAYDDA